MSVQWGFLKFKADAQKCYDEIQTLGKEYTPHQVLDLARDPKTELHKCFDWDDSIAAEKWRIEQARQVVKSFTVVIERAESKAPQAYRVVQHDPIEKVYRPVMYTTRNEDQYGTLLRRAKAELASFRQRYKSIVELENVIEAIETALAE